MSDAGMTPMPPSVRENSRRASIIGVGETDYRADYQAERARPEGWQPPEVKDLCKLAFDRAVADAGLRPEGIDALAMHYTFGGPDPADIAEHLGIRPEKAWVNGHIFAGPLPNIVGRIMSGEVTTVAMLFGIGNRSSGRQFGGNTYAAGMAGPSSYYYFHPWGWSSQAAHWALMATRYFEKFGKREEDLGHVPMTVRKHAAMNENAIMRTPFTIEEYMASRYIVRPLHLYDICLVNDGAVCLIVTAAERARDMVQTPVDVAGWSESYIRQDKLRVMVDERLRPQIQQAGSEALAMADVSIGDIGHFEGYDVASIHLVNQLEGFGFTPDGTGIDFVMDGQATLGGRIPTNIAGGNMSATYMQGWGQVPEIVRQLRGEAGERQIAGLEVSLSAMTQTDCVHPVIYTKGN